MAKKSKQFASVSEGLEYFKEKLGGKNPLDSVNQMRSLELKTRVGYIEPVIERQSIPVLYVNSKPLPKIELKKAKGSKRICCIYKITCTANGKMYIGSTTEYKRRVVSHKYNLKKGTHGSIDLQSDYNLFGVDAFVYSIAKELKAKDKSTLLFEEQLVIESMDIAMLYNKMAKIILFTDLSSIDLLLEEINAMKNVKSFRVWKN